MTKPVVGQPLTAPEALPAVATPAAHAPLASPVVETIEAKGTTDIRRTRPPLMRGLQYPNAPKKVSRSGSGSLDRAAQLRRETLIRAATLVDPAASQGESVLGGLPETKRNSVLNAPTGLSETERENLGKTPRALRASLMRLPPADRAEKLALAAEIDKMGAVLDWPSDKQGDMVRKCLDMTPRERAFMTTCLQDHKLPTRAVVCMMHLPAEDRLERMKSLVDAIGLNLLHDVTGEEQDSRVKTWLELAPEVASAALTRARQYPNRSLWEIMSDGGSRRTVRDRFRDAWRKVLKKPRSEPSNTVAS